MSFLILKENYTFAKAYDHIRSVREVASPNPAFWAQLYNFQIRIYGAFADLPSPRVFCIGSYQKETPQTLVARMVISLSCSLFRLFSCLRQEVYSTQKAIEGLIQELS